MFFISYKYDLMGAIIFHLFFILAKKAPANSFSRSLQTLDFKAIFNIAYSLLFTKCFYEQFESLLLSYEFALYFYKAI